MIGLVCCLFNFSFNFFPQEADAMSHVAGFTVAHDVSARDWQLHKNGGQWLIGKTFDTFCPIGPAIVPPAALSGMCSSIYNALLYLHLVYFTIGLHASWMSFLSHFNSASG